MGSVYGGRFDDARTSVSSARRDGGYTTVKRYVVKEEDTRSPIGRDRRFVPDRAGERVEETRIVRRERDVDEPRRDDPRYTERELVIRRERDEEPRRDYVYDAWRDEPAAERELVIRRTTERDDPRRDEVSVARYEDRGRDVRIAETRYRDDYEIVAPSRSFDDRDLQRYSRTAEYFTPPPQPTTIVIRQEPIIIRERVRDDDYQIVRKSDVEDERSVVRRDPQPRGEEDFFYEKKVRERLDDRRDDDDYYERRSRRRSVSPHDSVSQRGRDYSSDDSMVYVRKETREESPSPDRRKRLAAGVVAGVGAAELLRNHKKKEGRETSHGIGRVGRDIGAGALGALAAEGISRARSRHRSKSRHHSRDSRDRYSSRSRSRRRSRSRSGSPSKFKTLGAVGLGAAALAAAATIAAKRMNKNKEEPRRSRSQHRRESLSSLENDASAPSDTARNPKHRNKRIAEAGAAGAVVAGLIDRARSKSRARDGKERSRSRIRQALPIVAAGLGSAALAGLYEKNKAKKEAEEIAKEQRRARSRSRSRAKSDGYYDGPRDAALSDPGLIEYGTGPMYGNNFGPDYYGRPPPPEGYYGASDAVVPAAAGGTAAYAAQRGARSRSRSASRERGGRSSRSSSSSPERSKHGRRRSSHDAVKTAAAAGAGAIAASEYERHKQEKRERKARRRREEEGYGHDPYEDNYNPAQPYPPTPPPPANDPYASQQGFYPQTSQFPPPPGSVPQQYPPQQTTPTAGPAAGTSYPAQPYPPPPPASGPPPPTTTPYDAYGSGANPYAPRGPENVSAEPSPTFGDLSVPATSNDQNHVDGLNTAVGAAAPSPAVNGHTSSTSTSATYPSPIPNPESTKNSMASTARGVSPPRSQSQPAPSARRKSVQFADKPEISPDFDAGAAESDASSPERHRHKHKYPNSRGYESEDDTDSTPVDARHGRRDRSSRTRNLDPTGGAQDKRRDHLRRPSHEPTTSHDGLRVPPPERVTSPYDSDSTVELPPRFDEQGRRKTALGEDPLADRLEEILAGRGVVGKVFGNFLDGLLGPEGRKRGR
ncbi:hypothetical protein A1O1_05635 [Capronia coronata CBS 617.96]|uniref:DUF3824 domain-containing protein n=1 Tax=Capronia coronata CBS 617.96 TaxID=1182541 RepID=W9Y839_9EURO|nr:uncharacterized protein A1O1_05635 [Capronia coronata CBS 617.96]EXJ88703.1 hypothetical protein A1O1_05635 [Capronia coronata CBS 617.96]